MRSLPGVRDAVVMGVENDGVVSLRAGYTGERPSSRQLREELRDYLPEYMIPYSFDHWDALPRTASGKVDRLTCRRRLEEPR